MKEKEKIEITKVVLKMGNTEVALSLKDAREVFQVLSELFGQKTAYYPVYDPFRWWYYPDPWKPYITYDGSYSVGKWDVSGAVNLDAPKFELTSKSLFDDGTLTIDMNGIKANVIDYHG